MDVRQSLLSSVEEVLDKMAFMFFDETPEDEPAPGDFAYITLVNFNGVIAGALNLFVNRGAAEEIGRNLIGIREDDELHDDTLEDALREFTNLVMGRTMTILDADGPFDMDVPALVSAPEPERAGHTVLTLEGALDDEPFRIVLQYRSKEA